MKNQISVARMSKLILQPEEGPADKRVVASFIKNLEPLGFSLSSDLIQALLQCSTKQVSALCISILPTLRKMVGADKKYQPMYPNFPRQVMEASEAELYLNAILHYIGSAIGVLILPEYEEEVRDVLTEWTEIRVIGLGTEEEFHQMFANLMSSNTSISATDVEHLQWYLKTYSGAAKLPVRIPHKEILSVVLSTLLEDPQVNVEVITSQLKLTATDVLRLAVALSGGDVSLATKTKFRKFSRKERRFLLGLLDSVADPQEDMQRYLKRWIRLGEILHPGEYKKKFPTAALAFQNLQNNNLIPSFHSKVETQLLELDRASHTGGTVVVQSLSNLLMTRPGEYARRLDHLLRLAPENKKYDILSDFVSVANQVSTPVLLQLLEHFQHRHLNHDFRIFFPKGSIGKLVAIEDNLKPFELDLCGQAIHKISQVLIERFSELGDLGKVYIDPTLRGYKVPFSQRSASKALRTLVRGSRMPFGHEEKDTVRFFIWWKNQISDSSWRNRVDLDLSAIMYGPEWKYVEHISYTRLRSGKYNACHSGDITDAPKGACEFIDIDIPSALKYGARFIVMNVISFTGQPFVELPECYAGWMLRSEPKSGEIFDARTVQDKIDVSADTKYCIPLILDLQTREMIWADLAMKNNPNWVNNVEANSRGAAIMGKSIAELRKPDLYTLFELHALGRGTLVSDIDAADTVFSTDTAFEFEKIISEFLF